MQTRNWQKFFENEAPGYLENCFTKNTEYEISFLIEELGLKENDQVLDIGCGTGRHSLGLAGRKIRMTGIDLSHDMLSRARKFAGEQNLDIEFHQGDASQLRLDREFDHAICICEGSFCLYEEGIEPFGYHLNILRNVFSMLKPGGKFLLNALSALKMIREHSDEDVSKGLFDLATMSNHCEIEMKDGSKVKVIEKGFIPSELTELFVKAGFEVLQLWGGTAGSWNRQTLKLDEWEIMVVARKPV
ncbi:MAG: cyclopropane-fatty-acyl-phospholipid synthase [Candidatus Wallbacteria bacterium HGW-Wallbacteria-1]|jgi:cyclopropane fatty-acyl-phospholipid synthase-like methyltransferase|uniref:Cyclopropane-fatty-acyl-phospholipid synthase n=1 Tax=Candidatus Wallbacteria bacterium HGW-Wallbacteria-1 TaxID=2013854 RepID=A0A2N1PN58_9BACT|nr:MAG: cyclopropane-fatty-acyl-phospholipid synthase [Candidatus Wallbacteria bacterium HGW-Wallbacteria-1]